MERIEHLSDSVTLYLGDCREILPRLGNVDAVVTDPPYGIGYTNSQSGRAVIGRKSLRRSAGSVLGDNERVTPELLARLGVGRYRIVWGANHFTFMPTAGRWLVWDKTGGGRGPKDSFSDVEFAWLSDRSTSPGSAEIFHYLWKGVCQDGEKGEKRHHLTQKPVALMRWCLGLIPDAVTIADPFMGSGTTGVACVQLRLRFIGIELEQKHFDTACRRIADELKQPRLDLAPDPQVKQSSLFGGGAA